MRKVDVGEAKLYLGAAKEISHAYRHYCVVSSGLKSFDMEGSGKIW